MNCFEILKSRHSRGWVWGFLALLALGSLFTGSVRAAGSGPRVDFALEVRPLLVRRCIACHDREHAKGGLRLDSREAALKGGKSGKPVIVPGAPARSEFIQRITTKDPDDLMPAKGGPLKATEVALLSRWIEQGAAWPEEGAAKHWAFVMPERRPVPRVRNTSWPRNPIDAFVLARLEENGWQPSPRAENGVLLRRVCLDLTGLPPTLEEQDRFSRDPSRNGLDRLVVELLARPTYGERWGRHWLDVARYAETSGYERDAIKPNVWRYRDYVIAAFNQDKPYNRFILEQIAGDELPDSNAETLIATGFHRLGPWDDEPADPVQDRADQLDDMIRATAQAFLGVTLGCARCHDHKFDPLTTRDYYSMAAVFAPLERPQAGRNDLDAPAGSPAELKEFAERSGKIDALNQETESLRLAFRAEFLASNPAAFSAEALAAFRTPANQQTPAQKEIVKSMTPRLEQELARALPAETRERIRGFEETAAQLRRALPKLSRGYFMREPSSVPPKSYVMIRGRADNLGPEVGPAVPVALTLHQPEFPPPDASTTRRRLSLAKWIASAENPLTARVIVNRVWQHHFGEGLVSTPSDFGRVGSGPSHPELLDWLADWFVNEGGWSLKSLHRLILNSATWQQSALGHQPRAATADPENRLLWHFRYRRLEAEAIRDSMLAVSGALNPSTGGQSMYPDVPREALAGSSDPGKIWKPFVEADASRRTVYAFSKRSFVVPMLEVLDLCDSTQSSDKRAVTSVAPQALTLFNGEFVNLQARHFAGRLRREAGVNPDRQIELAWRLALARPARTGEVVAMRRFLSEEAAGQARDAAAAGTELSIEAAGLAALVQMCRVVLNLNEFVYLD